MRFSKYCYSLNLFSLLFTHHHHSYLIYKCDDNFQIVCLHPGIVSTNLYRYAPTPFRQLINGPIGRALFRSTTDAAVDIFHLATIDNLKSGEYYENGNIKSIPIIDHVLIDKLYNRVQEIVDDCDLCTES